MGQEYFFSDTVFSQQETHGLIVFVLFCFAVMLTSSSDHYLHSFNIRGCKMVIFSLYHFFLLATMSLRRKTSHQLVGFPGIQFM